MTGPPPGEPHAADDSARAGITPDLVTAGGQLWAALVDRDERRAVSTVLGLLDAGVPAERVLLEVIAPSQKQVGAAWAANRLTVADEHAATAINERVIAAMAHHHEAVGTPDRGRVLVCCVDGEWHALPARLLAEVLRLRGWRVEFLGAQVPTPYLVAHLHDWDAEVVALSCSIPTGLPAAHAAITACQATGIPVLVGGAGFGVDGRYARLLRADGWAVNAVQAEALLRAGLPTPDPLAARQPIDDLPHLADQEYTLVSRNASWLVRQCVRELSRHGHTTPTAADLAELLAFLTVGLYIGDPALFVDHVAWSAAIGAARGVAVDESHHALVTLRGRLGDYPRASAMVAQAQRTLESAA